MTGSTRPTQEYFDKGLWGWDGTRWRKVGLPWGYYDRFAEAKNATATAGTNVLTFSTVPAGQVWVIRSVVWRNVGTACSVINLQVFDGSGAWVVYSEVTPVVGKYFSLQCEVVLKASDRLRVAFYGCTLNDAIDANALGYKMLVA